jgi:pentatricopeptide repeat protein
MTKKKMKVKDMDSMLLTALIWVKTKQNVDEARKFFDTLYEKEEDLVNNIMVNHLMTGYGLKKDKENVIDIYNTSQKLNMSPTEQKRSKHHLTNALFHCRDVPAAISVFISMRNQDIPDDITLAMVVQGLVMNNENNLAWRLFKTLQSDGIEPNLHAYTAMIKAMGHKEVDLKKKQGASGLNDEMIAAAGIRLPNVDYLHSNVPSTTEALNLFRRLTGFQQPNVYTYTTLISCFAKHNISRAISIFDHMCAKNVQPTVETYTAILQGCAIFRNSQMALSVFNHMCEKRVEPNAVTWRYLMKSLLRSRVDKKQIEKIAEMARKSIDKKVD